MGAHVGFSQAGPVETGCNEQLRPVRPNPVDESAETVDAESERGSHGAGEVEEEAGEEREGEDGEKEVEKDLSQGGHGEQEEQIDQADEPSEGEERVRVRRAPRSPSKKEKEEHEATHCPYQEWCRHCVRGKGRACQHRSNKERNFGKVAKVHLDYYFMSRADEAASKNPCIVMVDDQTGEKYSRATGQKGLGEGTDMDWLIKDLDNELRAWGHAGGKEGHLVIKCDTESSAVAVRKALAAYHGGRCISENPPKGESPANGKVEEAAKAVREHMRVLKDHLEFKAQIELECRDPIVLWMVRWAAMLVSRFARGADGKTSYQRRTGKPCRLEVLPFGESVWFKHLKDPTTGDNKFLSPWEEGIWLGHARSSSECLVGTKQGVLRAWSVKRRPEEERWNADLIRGMQGTPQRPDPSKPGVDVPIRINVDFTRPREEERHQEPLRKEIFPRRLKITEKLLHKYGYCEDCEGCRRAAAGNMDARGHSEMCRKRIEEAHH